MRLRAIYRKASVESIRDASLAHRLARLRTLTTAQRTKARPRVAKEGEAAPAGFKRVPFSAVFEDGA
jgi:hypothetical protein